MIKFLAISVVMSTFSACGGQVDNGGAAENKNVGGSRSSAGGTASNFTGTTGGNTSQSNGGSTGLDADTFCGGVFAGMASSVIQLVNVTSCDFPLPQYCDSDAIGFHLLLGCSEIQQGIFDDAGSPDGYSIGYSQSQAQLKLLGSTCTDVLTKGLQTFGVVEQCMTFGF